MKFEKPKLEKLTWDFNDYQEIYAKGREGGDPDKALTPVTELVPPIAPFEEQFTQFCDYLTDPSIIMKDNAIVQHYFNMIIP